MPIYKALTDPNLVIIFSYAPAGLGHLRVTNTLFEGLPESTTPLLLGSNDETIRRIHRITSTYPILRDITELAQKDGVSVRLMPIYRRYLRRNTEAPYIQMKTIIGQRFERPREVLVVATHFGLAHQLAAVKRQLEKEEDVRIYLIVQVTDDSPQEIWYIDGADLLFVPSNETKKKLTAYGRNANLPKLRFVVNPYPISPSLSERLNQDERSKRIAAVGRLGESAIHFSIPVSGAAVGTEYYEKLLRTLHSQNSRYNFHIVSKVAPFTAHFLKQFNNKRRVQLITGETDKEVVAYYDSLYRREVISLEITKPSEQAFKAILPADTRGGVILLFSHPLGRQEYDNLDFLRRHFLLPKLENNKILWKFARENKSLSEVKMGKMRKWACGWRGILLPNNPKEAANFIEWCFKERIFSQMLLCQSIAKKKDKNKEELGIDGVEKFWKTVDSFVELGRI